MDLTHDIKWRGKRTTRNEWYLIDLQIYYIDLHSNGKQQEQEVKRIGIKQQQQQQSST